LLKREKEIFNSGRKGRKVPPGWGEQNGRSRKNVAKKNYEFGEKVTIREATAKKVAYRMRKIATIMRKGVEKVSVLELGWM